MKKFIFITIILFLSGCAATNSKNISEKSELYYAGGDGSSIEQAVFFPGAKSSTDGIPLEEKWLEERYPGYRVKKQSIIKNNDKIYDQVEIITTNGEEKIIYFDMTSWFGFPGLHRQNKPE